MSLVGEGIQFVREVYERRRQICDLTRRDFTDRYAGSFLGFIWAFIEPLAMMSIMWAVFNLGLKVHPSGSVPFVAYLFTGQIAYNFFAEGVGAAAGVIRAYSFLVKKVKFRVAILPIVKINSALIIHLIFLFIVMGIIWVSGIRPSLFWLQTGYYTLALLFLLLGLSWLLSALGVFVKDIANLIQIFITFGFWLTPIFWDKNIVPPAYQWYLCLNPMFYIVQGYRDSFLYRVPFWAHPLNTLYFWAVAWLVLLGGILAFKRLRPHFADIL
ncbi:MAG: ABC transporter permease [Desulfobacteraceae bacterium]|nr:ABC transporter permease [Desulfobacteraceae bacterium]